MDDIKELTLDTPCEYNDFTAIIGAALQNCCEYTDDLNVITDKPGFKPEDIANGVVTRLYTWDNTDIKTFSDYMNQLISKCEEKTWLEESPDDWGWDYMSLIALQFFYEQAILLRDKGIEETVFCDLDDADAVYKVNAPGEHCIA